MPRLLSSLSPRTPIFYLLIACVLLTLSGCSEWVYRQDIQQGNVLEPEDLNQIQLGMTKRQVAVLLGSPSVKSPFHDDRWDYVNTYARESTNLVSRTLTLIFVDDKLALVEGNYLDQDSETARLLRELQSADRQIEDESMIEP
jgi:outer membrane protein assembly factor BamE